MNSPERKDKVAYDQGVLNQWMSAVMKHFPGYNRNEVAVALNLTRTRLDYLLNGRGGRDGSGKTAHFMTSEEMWRFTHLPNYLIPKEKPDMRGRRVNGPVLNKEHLNEVVQALIDNFNVTKENIAALAKIPGQRLVNLLKQAGYTRIRDNEIEALHNVFKNFLSGLYVPIEQPVEGAAIPRSVTVWVEKQDPRAYASEGAA